MVSPGPSRPRLTMSASAILTMPVSEPTTSIWPAVTV